MTVLMKFIPGPFCPLYPTHTLLWLRVPSDLKQNVLSPLNVHITSPIKVQLQFHRLRVCWSCLIVCFYFIFWNYVLSCNTSLFGAPYVEQTRPKLVVMLLSLLSECWNFRCLPRLNRSLLIKLFKSLLLLLIILPVHCCHFHPIKLIFHYNWCFCVCFPFCNRWILCQNQKSHFSTT